MQLPSIRLQMAAQGLGLLESCLHRCGIRSRCRSRRCNIYTLVVVGFRSRMSACIFHRFVFKWLHRVLVYSKVVCTDVEFSPVVDLGDATFIRQLIPPRNSKQLFSSHDYSYQEHPFVVVRPLLSDLCACVEEPFLGRAKGSYSYVFPHHRRIMTE